MKASWEHDAGLQAKCVRHHRRMSFVSAVAFVLFAAFFAWEDRVGHAAAVRLCLGLVVPALVVKGLVTFLPGYVKRPHLFAMLSTLAVWVPAAVAFVLCTPPAFDLYLRPTVVLISLTFFSGLQLPLRHAVGLAVTFQAVLLVTAVAGGRWEGRALASVGVELAAIDLIGLGFARQMTASRQRDFVQTREIAAEKEKSERLLANILPEAVAARLKEGETRVAEQFPEATVLFADLVGFTELAGRLTAFDLVRLLDELFSRFDALAEHCGVEKIKTIGDAYMAVAGVPTRRPDHAAAGARLALGLHDVIRTFNASHGTTLSLRIGLHTGPVVAGVIGRKRLIYDLWGATVNEASRLESHGAPGRIHISRATAATLGAEFVTERRGVVALKGLGEQETYWLVSRAVVAGAA